MHLQTRDEHAAALSPAIAPMTQLSVQRTLKGSSQSDAQLFVTVTNHLPIEIRTAYLETMPWLLQFYLHTLRAEIDGRSRGMCLERVSRFTVAWIWSV